MRADLNNGWRKLKNRWGFDSSRTIPFRHGCSIRAHLRVTAHGSLAQHIPEFPGISIERNGKLLRYSLQNRILEVTIPLTSEQPWRTMSNGRNGLEVEERPFVRIIPRTLQFSFTSLIVFYEPNPAVPDVKEWGQKMFLHGGRPESNRRRF
jgi:hypothetical protein